MPTTLDEMVAAGEQLKADNADVPNFSGIYLPARNWHAAMSFVWEHDGDIATQEGEEWVGTLDSPESIAGLEFFKDVFDRANAAPADGDDANDWLAFCAGEVGMMPAPGWKPGQIINEDDGCPEMEANIGVFAMPGSEAGTTAPVFLGGSNIGIPVNSENQELAFDLLKVLVSTGFQKQFAEAGTIPALKSELASVTGSDAAEAQATAAREQPLRADQREVGGCRGGQRPPGHAHARSPRATTSPTPPRRRTRRSSPPSTADRRIP